MTDQPSGELPKKKQHVGARFFWFLAGAGVNYLLISTPFKYLRLHYPELPVIAVSACSLAISATFFFFWNYFVNFRTDSRKRDALGRYITAVAGMLLLSTLTLDWLKHLNFDLHFSIWRFPLDLDIVATQFFLGGFKFLLYHKWAFPAEKK
jgi:hypothetical protein